MEMGEGVVAQRRIYPAERGEARHAVGHVGRGMVMRVRQLRRFLIVGAGEIAQQHIAQRAAPRGFRVRRKRAARAELAIELFDLDVVDCLLYTSPSPRDRQKSRMPSS